MFKKSDDPARVSAETVASRATRSPAAKNGRGRLRAGPPARVRWSGTREPEAKRLEARRGATMERRGYLALAMQVGHSRRCLLTISVAMCSFVVVGSSGVGAQDGSPVAGLNVPPTSHRASRSDDSAERDGDAVEDTVSGDAVDGLLTVLRLRVLVSPSREPGSRRRLEAIATVSGSSGRCW
jgi:hypothetical protein